MRLPDAHASATNESDPSATLDRACSTKATLVPPKYLIGDVIRCTRCKICVEVIHCDCRKGGHLDVQPMHRNAVADHGVDWCAQCATSDERLGAALHHQAVAQNVAGN